LRDTFIYLIVFFCFTLVINAQSSPTSLTAQVVDSTIELSWSAPIDADLIGYNVYRIDIDIPLNTTLVTDLFYVDDGLSFGITYSYQVQAIYITSESVLSEPVEIVFITPIVDTEINSTFESGNPDRWVVYNYDYQNKWIVGNNTASQGDYSIYISNNGNTNYYATTGVGHFSNVHFFTDVLFSNAEGAVLRFDFRGRGSSSHYLRVTLCDTDYIPQMSVFPQGQSMGTYSGYTAWTQKVIFLPPQPVNTIKRIVFTWRNDTTSGNNPPAAVDNISIGGPLSCFNISGFGLFGQIDVGSTSIDRTIYFMNVGNAPFTVSSITLSGTNASDFNLLSTFLMVEVVADDYIITEVELPLTTPLTVSPNGFGQITVCFSPSSGGAKTASLTVVHDASLSIDSSSITLTGTGVPDPELTINPISHYFGSVIDGIASEPVTFTLSNTGGRNLTVSNITLNGQNAPDFSLDTSVFPWTISAGISKTFTISFAPTAVGERGALVNIFHSLVDSPAQISVSGTGIYPEINVSPTTFFYGEVGMGVTSPTATFTIANPSGGNLNIYNIALSGIYSGMFHLEAPDLPWNIPSDTPKQFTISFSPTFQGGLQAMVNITHILGDPPVSISLSGIGIPVPIFAPVNLSGTATGSSVTLSWETPETTFTYSSDVHRGFGLSGNNFTVAQRYTPLDLQNMGISGLQLTKIGMIPYIPDALNGSLRIKYFVWTPDESAETPGDVVSCYPDNLYDYSDPTTYVVYTSAHHGQWQDITLTRPIPIPVSRQLWIGFTVWSYSANAQPVGIDGSVNSHNYRNMIMLGINLLGTWTTLSNFYGGPAVGVSNWMIRGTATHPLSSDIYNTRNFDGYKVYRGIWGENSLLTLTPSPISAFTFTDTNVSGDSQYTYHVTTISTSPRGESRPISTNVVVPTSADDMTTSLLSTKLITAYPNPFNPTTTILFDIANPDHVTIGVYNIKGQIVKTLASGEYNEGRHSVVWNGDDSAGRNVGSGVYFYRMTTTDYVSMRKMILMK